MEASVKKLKQIFPVLALSLSLDALSSAQAETRVTYKSAKAGTSYYQMGVEIAQAIKAGSNGQITITLE